MVLGEIATNFSARIIYLNLSSEDILFVYVIHIILLKCGVENQNMDQYQFALIEILYNFHIFYRDAWLIS